MTVDEIKNRIKKAKYFRDSEGKLKIVEIRDNTFLVVDNSGEQYQLFYVDYAVQRQPFEIIL